MCARSDEGESPRGHQSTLKLTARGTVAACENPNVNLAARRPYGVLNKRFRIFR